MRRLPEFPWHFPIIGLASWVLVQGPRKDELFYLVVGNKKSAKGQVLKGTPKSEGVMRSNPQLALSKKICSIPELGPLARTFPKSRRVG